MAQRYIYLDEELNHKLKEEENVSELIRTLLNHHYNSLRGTEVKEKDIKIEVVELQKEIKEKKKEMEELKIKEFEEEKTEEEKAEIKRKHDEATEKLRDSILQEIDKQHDEKLLQETALHLLGNAKI